eukprot:CAMPEP_0169207364 /NCGR_PEP_ID=MMETSP1016-20121227/13552_1 /TAXON_ID=342587 /ORGANISM="Karlodinium micrum, Strain CCMP2283" /LENGTH=385 /DNA_ID=CAMNT_0009284653 /DNA_START=12 /DNA_END=1170 /DNA_ORIENTATION=-
MCDVSSSIPEQVVVRITAYAQTAYGEDLHLCGSMPALGSWDISNAAPMQWTEPNRWFVDLTLPCGVRIEFKVIRRSQNGTSWHGTGLGDSENLLLETSVGRQGCQSSRFLTGGPFDIKVEDIAFGSIDEESGTQVLYQVDIVTIILPPQSPENMAALRLAGSAAAAGHAVSCAVTTTTTTTTMFTTINGQPMHSRSCDPIRAGEVDCQYSNPQLPMDCRENGPRSQSTYLPLSDMDALSMLTDSGRNESDSNLLALTDDANTSSEASGKKYTRNSGIARMGFVVLQWRRSGVDVRVCGSWDGWQKKLELEPLQSGGFALAVALPPGEYECKFIVDGVWRASEDMDIRGDHGNNVVIAGDLLLAPLLPSSPNPSLALTDLQSEPIV